MAKPKSILEKFSETVKGLADSASQALKAEEPARVDETSAAYMPFAAEGLATDPLLVPPAAAQPPSHRKRSARKTAPQGTSRGAGKLGNKSEPKRSVGKGAKKLANARSKLVAKTAKRKGVPSGGRKAADRSTYQSRNHDY